MAAGADHADGEVLRREQYKDARNLDARIELHRRFSVNPQDWTSWVFEQLLEAVGPGAVRILEIGCGPGGIWKANRSRLPSAWSLCLSDFSEGMVREARGALATRARYALVDAQAIPFAAASFDAVIANHMLYHVADRALALLEMARVLIQGGVLFASTVGERHLAELEDRLQRLRVAENLFGRSSGRFTLENGGEQIAAAFGDVRLVRYEDSLRVTEVEPLIAYVRSTPAGAACSDAAIAEMRAEFAAEIAVRGAFSVFKDSGVFVARAA